MLKFVQPLLGVTMFMGIFFYSHAASSQQQLASVQPLQEKVKKSSREISLKKLLNEISKELGIHFNYDSNLVESQLIKMDEIKIHKGELEKSLKEVLKKVNLDIERIENDNYVIFSPSTQTGANLQKSFENTVPANKSEGNINRDFATQASAIQDFRVNGKIEDEDGLPLPGVTVVEKGTSNGTVTNMEGNYNLQVSGNDVVLVFSFIGYETKEVEIDGRENVNITLEVSSEALDEVVVTSFGVKQEKKALGYAVQEVSGEEIARTEEPNLVNALRGKVAGVSINSSSGAAGAGANIIIRGITSLSPSGDNQPLFVVDGMPISNSTTSGSVLPSEGSAASGSNEQYSFTNRAADINPEDIESISILKGPSATALYGLRAANGAVIITTKKGKEGRTQVRVKSTVAFEEVNKTPDIQMTYREGWRGRARAFEDPDSRFGYTYGYYTWGPPNGPLDNPANPHEEFYRTGLRFNNYASISGGTNKTNFYTSVSNMNQEGIVPNTNYNRTTIKISGETTLAENFKVSGSANYTNSGGSRPNGGDKSVVSNLRRWSPTIDVNDYLMPDGSEKDYTNGVINNPLYLAMNSTFEDDVNRIIGNVGFNYTPFEWMTVDYKIGLDYYNDSRVRFAANDIKVAIPVNGFMIEENINYKEINSNFLVTLQKDFNQDFSGSLTLGNQVTDINYDRLNTRGEGFNLPDFEDLSNTTNLFTNKNAYTRRLVGVFADAKLNYKETLFLNVTARNDWSSTLPRENRSFFYPSVNMGYIFTETLDTQQDDFLSYGKLRASWAKVGKDASPYVVGQYFEGTPGFPLNGIGGFKKSNSAGDLNLKPETTTSYEFGTDLRFWGNRIGVDLTYFQQASKNQIVSFPVSNPSGLSRFTTNAGEIESTGIEALIDIRPVQTDDFSWDITLNWSRIRSEVLSLPEGLEVIEFQSSAEGVTSRVLEGGSPGDLYGYGYERTANGELLIDDAGFPNVDRDSLKYVGSAMPDWTGGITNSFSYKNFNLSFLVEVKQGGDAYDESRINDWEFGTITATNDRYKEVIFQGVTANGQPNTQPVILDQDYYRLSRYNAASELLMQDASWVRLRSASLSYRLPNSILDRTFFTGITLSATGNNLLLITPFEGYDPEGTTYSAGSNAFGLTGYNIPNTRSVIFGLSLNF
ncbi:SusC/RagA family TonB-linked outer membrane protein [Autumnicola musiva]|uniref:SusC/RagA family TonB-linked outer membrane protein n=1 Tax=Autumnicola musiva TaxID=3075589 RepID=A0ABU3D8X8_9FLAO|nr:SusC/RagA family TonB-linked outer membrane protein [Zunongwangia sp. F117]MDT0677972.1 SusC/RagA family TonB-linked outer membrane protein [Zunongwangia sp. F117]